MLGGYSNVEGVDLRQRGKDPVITPVDQLGVPTYDELVLVANRKALEEDPEKFRLFIAALQRGTEAAVKQPNAATKAVLEANDGLDPKLTEAEVEATLPLLAARTPGQPYGYMDPRRVAHLRRLDARQRPDRVAAGSRANCSATTTCSGEIPE